MNYYNEFDPFAAQWLRKLIEAGLIPQGDVDDRSIVDVRGDDLRGYEQCHFFAGIGGWAYALELAGWEGECWTGSCPCQPFSVAGAGKGTADERHLWPAFRRLIEECSPPVVFGEQVASEAGRTWFTGVRADLEELGYACGAADLCAAGVTAPHIRQRLYWVADAGSERVRTGPGEDAGAAGRAQREVREQRLRPDAGNAGIRLADHDHDHDGPYSTGEVAAVTDSDRQDGRLHRGSAGRVGDTCGDGGSPGLPGPQQGQERLTGVPHYASRECAAWDNFRIIECGDGKYRRIPVEPALFPLVDGVPNRVGTLRGAGNAIVPPLGAEFVQAFMEIDAR